MQPPRFVSLCLVYSGALLVASQILIYSPDHWLATVGNTVTGFIILATGVYRIRSERGEETPEEYGLLTYVVGTFALLVTALFLFPLSIVR